MASRPLYGTKTALNVTGLSTLASGGTATSDELDATAVALNGMSAFFDVAVGQATPESSTVDVYIQGTNTSGNYGTTAAKANTNFIGSVDLSEATPKKNIAIGVIPPFFKLVFVNSGAVALNTGTVEYVSQTYQEAN